MKDNLHQTVIYSSEAPGADRAAQRTAFVVGYSPDGTVVFLKDEGSEEQHKLAVGDFLVRRVLKEATPEEALVAAGLALPNAERETRNAEQGPEPAGDTRRLSETPIAPATRSRMGKRAAPDHGAAAAGPDEFAKPSEG